MMYKHPEFAGETPLPKKTPRAGLNTLTTDRLEPRRGERPPSHLPAPAWHLRSRSSQALMDAEIEAQHRQAWDCALVGLIVVDAFGALVSSNATAKELLPEVPSAAATVFLSACLASQDIASLNRLIDSLFKGETASAVDVQIHSVGGPARYLRVTPVAVGSSVATLMLTDVTELTSLAAEKRQAEERMSQLQRLELIQARSSGIAHDFKNIMQVIESYAAILNGQAMAGHQTSLIATQIMTAASRGTILANRWLAFGRSGQMQKQLVDIGQFIAERLEQIEHSLDASIRMEKQCEIGIAGELDPCLIEQVLFNLCYNARDAMPRGGVLKVSLQRVAFDTQASSHDLLPAGVYAQLTVTDNGIGIAAEHMDRIFEPFFTTKESWEGTGLGLPIVQSIIREHHGAIEVWSEPNNGSVFTVYLPVEE